MQYKKRDDYIAKLINFILRFASEDYRKMIEGSIRYGLAAAARDMKEGREIPDPLDFSAYADEAL